MARVTVEDCIEKIPNRFELVLTASQRARQIGSGAALTVDRDNDKNPVVALREVADETVSLADLQEELIKSHQRVIINDDGEDVIDSMDGEDNYAAIAAAEFGNIDMGSDDDDDADDMGDDMDGDDDL